MNVSFHNHGAGIRIQASKLPIAPYKINLRSGLQVFPPLTLSRLERCIYYAPGHSGSYRSALAAMFTVVGN